MYCVCLADQPTANLSPALAVSEKATRSFRKGLLLGACLLASFAATAEAEELTWIPGGSNDWTVGGGNWAGGKHWANGDSAIFGGTAQPVTLSSSSILADTLTFQSDYTFSGLNPEYVLEFSRLVMNAPSRAVTFSGLTVHQTESVGAISNGTINVQNASRFVMMGVEAFTNGHLFVHDTSSVIVSANSAFYGGQAEFLDSAKLELRSAGIVGGQLFFSGEESSLVIDAQYAGSITDGSLYFTGAHAHLEAGRAHSIIGGYLSFSGTDATLGLHVANALTAGEIHMRGQNAHLYSNKTGALAGGTVHLYRQASLTLSDENATTKAAEVIFHKGTEQYDNGGYINLTGHSTTLGAISSADWGAGNINNTTGGAATFTTDFDTATKTYSGSVTDTAATALTFRKAGTGTLNLYGTNTHHGETIVSGGVLGIRDVANLSANSPTLRLDGGTARLTEQSINFGLKTLAVNSTGGTFDNGTYNAAFQHLNGSGHLMKAGSGILYITGDGTYTGDFSITGGRFENEGSSVFTYGSTTGTPTLSGHMNVLGRLNLSGNSEITAFLSGDVGTRVTKNDSGTAVLHTANTYGGTTTINGGTLGIANDQALGTSTLVINGGGIRAAGAAHTIDNAVTLNGSFTLGRLLDFTGAVTLANDVTITSANPDSSAFAVSRFFGNITGNHFITFAEGEHGIGVIGLGGSNSMRGVNFAGGIVRLDSQNALGTSGPLSFSGGTLQYTAGNQGDYSSRFTRSGDQQIRIDTNGENVQYNSDIAGTNTSLTKLGAGTLTFAIGSSYTGGTFLHGSTLGVNHDQALGSGRITVTNGAIRAVNQTRTLANAITLDGTLEAGRLTNFTGDVSLASDSTISTNNPDGPANADSVFSGIISGAHSLTIQEGLGGVGTGAIVLTNTNAYDGGTFLKSGVLAITNSLALGTVNRDVIFDGGTLQLRAAMNLQRRFLVESHGGTYHDAGHISYFNYLEGIGTFTKAGSGLLTLNRSSVFEGVLHITDGSFRIDQGAALHLGSGGTSGSLIGNIIADGALVFHRSDAVTYSQDISGTGHLAQDGTGTLTLTGTNTQSGGAVLNAGILHLGSANALSTGPVAFNGGTLQFSAANHNDYSSRFSTAANQRVRLDTNGQNVTLASHLTSSGGSLTKIGSGTLRVSGTNTYSGGTLLLGGELHAASGQAFGTGQVVVQSGRLLVESNVAIGNHVVLSGGTYARQLAAGSLANSVTASSALGAHDTTARILAGTSGSATPLETSFALGHGRTLSDVYNLTGTGSNVFVLELSFVSTESGSYLGWLNSSNQWVNAREGNVGNNPLFTGQYQGSFAEFQAEHHTLTLAETLGAWGVDHNGNVASVWTVLNHNSAFAAIPEPSTWALLGLGLVVALALRSRRMFTK